MTTAVRTRFQQLHESGCFLIPNPWDVGSARILETMGAQALATTSSGFAASLGKPDQKVTRDELVAHVAAVTAGVAIPVNVDAERCYADDPGGVAETVSQLCDAGASGISIEDYNPNTKSIETLDVEVERVGAAAEVCNRHGVLLTGRCEMLLLGATDLDEIVARLQAYRAAGAHVAYSPGLRALDDIARVVAAVPGPHNVLAIRNGPSVGEMASVGVRRVSTGGALAWAAYGALAAAAHELLEQGTSNYQDGALPRAVRSEALRD